jgi:hypothetical protein
MKRLVVVVILLIGMALLATGGNGNRTTWIMLK